MTENKTIISLYDHFKNSPKKLKIVCDWDEVIQVHEPYALWMAKKEWTPEPTLTNPAPKQPFSEYFDSFWGNNTTINNPSRVKYSPFGSSLSEWCVSMTKSDYNDKTIERQIEIKNSPDFYQQAPFLTIAEDLLKLIKEDKVEKLIFLSAYDKRKFPNGDERKCEIFKETFGKLGEILIHSSDNASVTLNKNKEISFAYEIHLQLIPFDSETQGQTKAIWIEDNASDFDVVIDDNPKICENIILRQAFCSCVVKFYPKGGCCSCDKKRMTVIVPYYPAIENQHHKNVLLVKQAVSNLKLKDFSK